MADDADMVTWVATCGGVTRSGELKANDDDVVAALWAGDIACMDEKGGSFEIGPVMDGGWFWVTDDMNSAVGGLVNKDVLKNTMVDIADAGKAVDAGTANGISAMLGQPSVAMSPARASTRLTGVAYEVSVSTGDPGAGSMATSGSSGEARCGANRIVELPNSPMLVRSA